MSEAAFTRPNGINPAYINARREDKEVDGLKVPIICVRVRTDGAPNASYIDMSIDEFNQWLAHANRVVSQP